MRGISRLAEELLDSHAGLRSLGFGILTLLSVFQVAHSREVTVQTLHVRPSVSLTMLFQVSHSREVTVQTLHVRPSVRPSHFPCCFKYPIPERLLFKRCTFLRPSVSLSMLFTFLNEVSCTYLIQQLAEGDGNLAVVSHTIQRVCRIISRPAVHTRLWCIISVCYKRRIVERERERGLQLVGIGDVRRIAS